VVDGCARTVHRHTAHPRVCVTISAVDGHCDLAHAEIHHGGRCICVQRDAIGDHLDPQVPRAGQRQQLLPFRVKEGLSKAAEGERQGFRSRRRQPLDEPLEPVNRHVAERLHPPVADAHLAVQVAVARGLDVHLPQRVRDDPDAIRRGLHQDILTGRNAGTSEHVGGNDELTGQVDPRAARSAVAPDLVVAEWRFHRQVHGHGAT
jgi:hypothetical protein